MNTVMEVQMKGPENNDGTHPCIVQYILFPPHVVVGPKGIEKDSGSEEETTEGKFNFTLLLICLGDIFFFNEINY